MDKTVDSSVRLMELWGEMASRMASAAMSVNPQSAPPEAIKQVRAAVFQAMSQFADQFMRSPEFLQSMKQSFDSGMQFREQLNEILTRMHHEVQGVARQDIDSVLKGVHQLESRLVDRMEDIARQLERISKRLDAMEEREARTAPIEAKKPRRSQP